MDYIKDKISFFVIILGISIFMGMTVPVEAAPSNGNTSAYQAVFNADYYYNAYPDLQAAFGNDAGKLFSHFVNYGIKEGRSGCSEFNIAAYRANNPDLVAAFGNNLAAYCRHYINFGKAEGRITTGDVVVTQTEQTPVKDNAVIATCTTYYETGVPRAANIDVAVSRLNGTIVQPGAEFSFSNTILPRTSENGYVAGPAYSAGKVIQSVGGGICQVSSTLYAAMLNGSIPASERHAHSMAVPYLPAGMDATISGNTLDLKFVNQQGYPILIQASAQNGALIVTLSRI